MKQESHTRWNFIVITADAAFFIGALAFVEPFAVLPVFIRTLTDSTIAIGILITIQRAGWLLPQLPAASLLQHRPRKKPFLLLAATAGRLPFAFLAVVVYFWAGSNPALVLWLLMFSYAIFYATDGMSCLAWNDIIAKSIPANFRGRLFGAQQFIGAAIAISAGEVVRRVLAKEGLPYPANYALLFAILFAGMMLSSFFLSLVREPLRPVAAEPQKVAQLLKMIPRALRERQDFRRMVWTQSLVGVGSIAAPFYVIYAEKYLGAPPWVSGIFIWAGTVGGIVGSLAWAYLNDRHGSLRVIRGVCWLALLGPVAAILVPLFGLPAPLVYYAFAVVFALGAAGAGGNWIGFTNFLLEIVNDEERAAFLGITPTLLAPMILMPLIGGLLLKVLPYEALFALAAAGGLAGWLASRTLREPRTVPLPLSGS